MLPGCVSSRHLCSVSKNLHLFRKAGKEKSAPPLSKVLMFALGEMKPSWFFILKCCLASHLIST